MPKPHDEIERVQQAFRQARSELGRIGSVRDEIERRIAATSIKNSPGKLFALAICTAGLFALASLFVWHFRNTSPLPPGSVFIPTPAVSEESKVEIGDAELTEHMAAILDRNVVVVIWSYRGPGMMAMPTKLAECSAGKYLLSTLREIKLADGRTFVCSMLVPNADVRPILEPPSIYAKSGDSGIMSLSVSPRAASTQELTDAIRSAGGIDVENILHEIQLHTR